MKGVRIVKDIKIAYNNKCRNETYFIERMKGRVALDKEMEGKKVKEHATRNSI